VVGGVDEGDGAVPVGEIVSDTKFLAKGLRPLKSLRDLRSQKSGARIQKTAVAIFSLLAKNRSWVLFQ
jgi:hypothetical protein